MARTNDPERRFRRGYQEEINYNIVEKLGVVSRYRTGWQRELNIVEWNGGDPKFDLRDWDPSHEKMSKGITLARSEARKLAEILAEYVDSDKADAVPETTARMAEEEK